MSQEGFDQESFDCFGKMPNGCYQPLAINAVGGNNIVFPKEAAPIWGTGNSHIVLLENHYEIPNDLLETNSKDDIIDSSGYNVYFTNKLRQYDVGLIMYGPNIDTITIPAKKNNFLIQDYCPSTCTQKYMAEEGINAFAYALHGHEVLSDISQQIIHPDGSEESFDYNQYDFNKQKIFYFNTHKKITKNDSIKLKCYYNTMSRSDNTYGGDGTKEEMCFSFIYYYPYENGHTSCSATRGEVGCRGLIKNVRNISDKILDRKNMQFKGIFYPSEKGGVKVVLDDDSNKGGSSSYVIVSYFIIYLIFVLV